MSAPQFDFITNREFRESIERDYTEVNQCTEVKAWKGVVVLAGSIVETLLVEALSAIALAGKTLAKDPLKMDLAEAIAACKEHRVISPRTADLCSVVRQYRNLIHPGRVARLAEKPPDEASATIAIRLVDIIAAEVAEQRRAAMGPTAEQLASKLRRDTNALTVVKHTLPEVSETERERLLLDVLPDAYLALETDPFSPFYEQGLAERFRSAFRMVFDAAVVDTKLRTVKRFARLLREGDGPIVAAYSSAFVHCVDILHLTGTDRDLCVAHLVERIGPAGLTPAAIELMSGITQVLPAGEAQKWVDLIARAAINHSEKHATWSPLTDHVLVEAATMTPQFRAAVEKRFKDWIKFARDTRKDEAAAARVSKLQDYASDDIPF